MKRILKWTAVVVLVAALGGFLAFLYLIPPFFVAAPETFSKPVADAPPPVSGITDPAERAIAERGRYLVTVAGCIGCHATNGAQGPDYSRYLAGGSLKMDTPEGTYVSRNLTSDKETGLARRNDEQVKRVLRNGVFPDGHIVPATVMPWPAFANWTEEDRHAVVAYLRHLPAVRHEIPEPTRIPTTAVPAGAVEAGYAGKDYGNSPAK
jgi:mono/diheme cytochrome c family protein